MLCLSDCIIRFVSILFVMCGLCDGSVFSSACCISWSKSVIFTLTKELDAKLCACN